MRIYFAAPLFSQAERTFNEHLAQQLESLGFQVFLPQRDGVENDKPPYDAMTKEERRRAIFSSISSKCSFAIFSCLFWTVAFPMRVLALSLAWHIAKSNRAYEETADWLPYGYPRPTFWRDA